MLIIIININKVQVVLEYEFAINELEFHYSFAKNICLEVGLNPFANRISSFSNVIDIKWLNLSDETFTLSLL